MSSDTWTQIGPYTVLRKIGEGAMGTVFLGRHEVLRAEHAIKVLSSDLTHDPTARERFLREARHSARLDHPHIVRVLNADLHGDQPYMVMEYIKGRTVSAMLSAGPLPPHRAVRYAYQVALALGAAHGQGVIHRDVKPDNVMVTDDDMAKLMDFGLVLAKNNAEVGLTAAGISMGTPYFMSPEQWFDEGVDDRADIYALGVTLYHMLSKRYPFEGQEPLEVAQRMMKHELLHLQAARSDVDPALATIVHRAMARTPAQRYPQAVDLADALARWWQQHPPSISHMTLDQPLPTAASSMITRQPSRSRIPAPSHDARSPLGQTISAATYDFGGPRAPTGVALKRPTPTAVDVGGPRLQSMPTALQPQAARELAPNTYWLSRRAQQGAPSANTYLRAFRAPSSGARASALINPCADADIDELRAKVEPTIGALDKLSLVFVSHPDPQVGVTASLLCPHLHEQAPLLASAETWRAINGLGVRRSRFVAASDYPKGFRLPTGQSLSLVPLPFCTSAGSVALFDPETRTLFSGELFSSLFARDAHSVWADDSDWSGVRAFHQLYMPCGRALARALDEVRALAPAVVAPHYGRPLRADTLASFIERLSQLEVGVDSLDAQRADAASLPAWDAVLQQLTRAAIQAIGPDALALLTHDPLLRDDLQRDPTATSGLRVARFGAATVARCWALLAHGAHPTVASSLRAAVEGACKAQRLPAPAPPSAR